MYHLRCLPAGFAPVDGRRPARKRNPHATRRRSTPRFAWKILAVVPAGVLLGAGIVVALVGFRPPARENLRSEPVAPLARPAPAAVEAGDLNPGAMLKFSGDKYTLYKSQINPQTPKNAHRLSLKDSFAQSVNPVFGRLGANLLGRDVIESYAEAFGFNREIDFELPLRPSRIELADGAFELAEVASGFNRTTRISPLHGAAMAAAIVNQGRWVEPTIIDWVNNDAGQTVYQSQTVYRERAIDRDTAKVLRQLMQATVQSGTAHKEFQKHHGDKVLSRLEIGGKTGSMGDGTGEMRYDWFVGYACEPPRKKQLVVAVVVAHEGHIGTRAAAYAVTAMKEYFQEPSGILHTQAPAAPRS